MGGSTGHANGPRSIHQTEVLTNFCKNSRSDLSQAKHGQGDERLVALVYQWENKVSRLRQREGIAVPLTHIQLLSRLCGKRFVEPEPPSGLLLPEVQCPTEPSVEMDADRRLMYAVPGSLCWGS